MVTLPWAMALHTAKWPKKPYFFVFSRIMDHTQTYITDISIYITDITYISQQMSHALYIYISQIASQHIQKFNTKSTSSQHIHKFTNTYPEIHKSINAHFNKSMAEVSRRTVVGRRAEVGTTGLGGASWDAWRHFWRIRSRRLILQKKSNRVNCMWDKNQVLKL